MQLSEGGMFLPEEVVKSPGNQDHEEGRYYIKVSWHKQSTELDMINQNLPVS